MIFWKWQTGLCIHLYPTLQYLSAVVEKGLLTLVTDTRLYD